MTYLQPGLLLVIVALAIGIRMRSRKIQAGAVALLFLWSWEPVAAVFSGSLEWWYPIRQLPAGEADVIVVLSGGIYKRDQTQPEDLPAPDTHVRVSYASWLYRNWRQVPILASGGVTGKKRKVVLAAVMRKALEEKGVPAAMIWTEERSRSTYENALYSAEMLRAKGIRRVALVTEAHHMLRAEGAFRRQGLIVTPAPCAYRYVLFAGRAEQFIPTGKAINTNEIILHEWVGLLWYRISGKA